MKLVRGPLRRLAVVAFTAALLPPAYHFGSPSIRRPANSPVELASINVPQGINARQDDVVAESRRPVLEDADKHWRISDVQQGDTSEVISTPEPDPPISVGTQSTLAANPLLELVRFDNVRLADAMKLFSEESGLNVITSGAAGETQLSVYLRRVTAIDALDAIVKANGLFYHIEEGSQIVRIATSDEYTKDLQSFRDEETRVFTLLYPNPTAVAQVISQVFGDRVELNIADADTDDLRDLSQRFNRFDLVDGRSLGLGTFDSGGTNSGTIGGSRQTANSNNLSTQLGLGTRTGSLNGLSNRSRSQDRSRSEESLDWTSEQIQELENQLARNNSISDQDRADLMQRAAATIYVSTIRRNNQVIVRTGDKSSMEQIESLIARLDVPTPTVMLEVKVLRVGLADGMNSAFEYFGGSNDAAAAYSDGNLLPPFPGGSPAARSLAKGLGVSGQIPGALTFQVVDNNFQFRMQLLESQSRVTALATPLILTANNEVSRIFVGDTLPFTVGFTPSQVVGGINANGAVAATPITELRDVGQSLLITPNINADRTVTLRIVEENSERILGGASIPVPDVDGAGVTSVEVDTVRRRTMSGTVVAQDGMAVALGGLIEEHISDDRDQVPVLGDIPGLGFFFRRQATNRSRSELVVVIRPYVFNTPAESAAASEQMLSELSLHPTSTTGTGTLDTYLPFEPVRTETECRERAGLLRLHGVRTVVR